MFCRMRPFWVVPAAEQDRHALRKTHENMQLIIDKPVDFAFCLVLQYTIYVMRLFVTHKIRTVCMANAVCV